MEKIIEILIIGGVIAIIRWVHKEYFTEQKSIKSSLKTENKSIKKESNHTKNIMFGIPVDQIQSHEPTNLISYLKELENKKSGDDRGSVQIFGNNVFDTDEKLLASEDFYIWAGNLSTNYPQFAFFLRPESVFLIMMADLMGSGLYKINKEKQIEYLNNILPECTELGIKKGYTKVEMEDYFNKNYFSLIR